MSEHMDGEITLRPKRRGIRLLLGIAAVVLAAVIAAVLAAVTVWQYQTAGATLRIDSHTDGYLVRWVALQTQALSDDALEQIADYYNAAEKTQTEGASADAALQVVIMRGSSNTVTLFYTPEDGQVYAMHHQSFLRQTRSFVVDSSALADYLDLLLLEFQPDRL